MSKSLKISFFILGVLMAVRLALPFIVKWKANRELSSLTDYKGHVDGVHLALWRGAFVLKDIEIEHKAGDMGLTIKRFSFQLSWKDLFKRALVADATLDSPRLRMLVPKPVKATREVKEKSKDVQQEVIRKTGKSLPDLLASLSPFRIRHFQLEEGSVRLQESGPNLKALQEKDKEIDAKDSQASQKEKNLEARITHIDIDVNNLTNTPELAGTPYATGRASAQIMDEGKLYLDMKLNPIAKQPAFNLNVAVLDVQLKEWNPVLRWQWGIDVKQGSFAMYTEAAARDGAFKGYVKPFVHKLQMHDPDQDKEKKLGAKIKEAMVDILAAIFKNSDSKNVASRVPFEGKFDNPQMGIWEAVFTVLRNAFIKALTPGIEKSVNRG